MSKNLIEPQKEFIIEATEEELVVIVRALGIAYTISDTSHERHLQKTMREQIKDILRAN